MPEPQPDAISAEDLRSRVEVRDKADLAGLTHSELLEWREEGERLREQVLAARAVAAAEMKMVARQSGLVGLMRRLSDAPKGPSRLDVVG